MLKRWIVKGTFKMVRWWPCGYQEKHSIARKPGYAKMGFRPQPARSGPWLDSESLHCFVQQAAAQGVGQGFVDMDLDELADQQRIGAAEVDDTVVLGATLEHARVLLRVVGNQDALGAADHAPAIFEALLVEAGLENLQALLLDLDRGVVGQIGRRGAGTGAIDEGVGEVETDLLHQLH